MTTTLARKPFTSRGVPQSFDAFWVRSEFSNVQQAMTPSVVRTVKIVTDTPKTTDSVVLYDATVGAISVTLPLPSQVQELKLTLKKIDASANAVTLVGTIDGSTSNTLSTQYQGVTIVSDGITWYKVASV